MKPDPLEQARKLIAAFPEPAREEEQDSVDVARALIALDEQVKAYREALEKILELPPTYEANDLHFGPMPYPTSVTKAQKLARAVLQRFTEGSQDA